MIQLRTNPGDKLIELGGGACPQIRPNVDVRMCHDANGNPTVDFTADFEEPLPIQSNEFDGVFSQFSIEHISWRKVRQFVGEILRILRPGGKAVIITANTEAQLKWIKDNPSGWDGKDAFDSCSCVLFGDNTYKDNSHRAFFSPAILSQLFQDAGFENILVQPYGERNTDMVLEASKPVAPAVVVGGQSIAEVLKAEAEKAVGTLTVAAETAMPVAPPTPALTAEERAALFDKVYFNGGHKVGGYAHEGYWDFPVHETTARYVLARKPQSVFEIGAGRGYIMKRIQDAGIPAQGMEISKHCYLSRVCDWISNRDICKTPWTGYADKEFDLAISVAVLEHIPEELIPAVSAELARVSKRGLHGIDFGERDSGFDRTHCSLHPKSWWVERLPKGHEVVDKEDLERGTFPEDVLKGDGKVKLNIGSYTTCYHHGWTNIDLHDLTEWAKRYSYNFLQCDVRNGLPYQTGTVDLISLCHFFEHLTYDEGLRFLRECRRVLKPSGAMRILVPNANQLIHMYADAKDPYQPDVSFSEFDEINDGAANASTDLAKLWALLHSGHAAAYDYDTLAESLLVAGFEPKGARFRHTEVEAVKQILRETLEMMPCLTLAVDAVPRVGEGR